jgi:hypothetical protein
VTIACISTRRWTALRREEPNTDKHLKQCQADIASLRSKSQVEITVLHDGHSSPTSSGKAYIALGLEGSANKLGAGVIKHDVDGSTEVLSNVRHTYITPPGEGFLPRDTAQHHREWAIVVIKDAVAKANITMHDVDCICYTKGWPDPL